MTHPETPPAVITQDLISLLERAAQTSRDRIVAIDASVRSHQDSILRLSDERDKILHSLGEAEKVIQTLQDKYLNPVKAPAVEVVPPVPQTQATLPTNTPTVGVVPPSPVTGGDTPKYKPEYTVRFQGDPARLSGFFQHSVPKKTLAQSALDFLREPQRQQLSAVFTPQELQDYLKRAGHQTTLSEVYVLIRSLVQQSLIRFEPVVPGVRRTCGYVVIPQGKVPEVKVPEVKVPEVKVPEGQNWQWKCRCLEGVMNHQAWNHSSITFCPLCLATRESAVSFKAISPPVVPAPTVATPEPVAPVPTPTTVAAPTATVQAPVVKKGRTLNPVSRHGNYPAGCQKTTRDLLDYLRGVPGLPITISDVEKWYEGRGLKSEAKKNGLRSMASHILVSLASGGYLTTIAPRVYRVKP